MNVHSRKLDATIPTAGRRRYTTPTLSAFGAVADLTRSDIYSCSNDGNDMGCITDPSNMGKMFSGM